MLFIDESIQEALGYICVGIVFCTELPDAAITAALLEAKLTPRVDEYKSGIRMASASELHALRDRIGEWVLNNCKIAVYVASREERPNLLSGLVTAAGQLVEKNNLPVPQRVYVDNGISGQEQPIDKDSVVLITGCDSKLVMGIQLADYVAYHCSYLLKCELEGRSKTVRVDANPHPLSGEQIELDWLLRTEIRRNFFTEHRDVDSINGDDWFFNVRGFGAFYSERLPDELVNAAAKTFDQMYFGCVW